eukprot:gene15985-19014_t
MGVDKEAIFRYCGLFFICLITFGSYYSYDIPAAFPGITVTDKDGHNSTISMLAQWYGVDQFDYTVLYSVYSFPNMVLPLLGGFFIDTIFGLRFGAMFFCVLVMAGQILFALSASLKLYWLAALGRTVFGLGGESLSVAQSTFCATWFNGRSDLNLAFSITLGFSRIGSAVNFQVTGALAKKSAPMAVWVGAIACGISFFACVVLMFLEMARTRKEKVVIKNDPVKISDITKFPLASWIIFLIIICFYVPLFVYIAIGNNFLASKFPHISSTEASSLMSIPYYTAAGSPVIGFLIDRVGRNLSWMAFASTLLTAAHIILGFTTVTPYVGMIMMGFGYACMASSVWTTLPALIPASRLGTAYGIAFATQNAAVGFTTMAIGAILVKTNNNYNISACIFVAFSALCLALVILMIFVDLKTKKINVPSAVMKENIKAINAVALNETTPLINNVDDQ